MKGQFLEWLRLPGVVEADLDSEQTISLHRRIIAEKPFLGNLYLDYYRQFTDQAAHVSRLSGKMLEIGSGGGFLKSVLPDVITSDVCADPMIDRVISAAQLPFENQSLKAIFCLNVLHHLAQPERFFGETQRTLQPRGRLVMIEPFNSWWGRIFYKNFHHEPFDETVASWEMPEHGRLSTSNQAIPWIIFHRDRRLFESRFPGLRIAELKPHTVLRYAMSGGMTYRAMVPSFTFPLFGTLDRILSVFVPFFPIFETIVLERQ